MKLREGLIIFLNTQTKEVMCVSVQTPQFPNNVDRFQQIMVGIVRPSWS